VQVPTYADGTYSDGRGASFYDAYHKVRGTDPNPTGTAVDEEIQHRYANPTLPGLEHFGGF
jgi:hypothetical protein